VAGTESRETFTFFFRFWCISEGIDRDSALNTIEEAIAGCIETLSILKKPVSTVWWQTRGNPVAKKN